MVVLRGVYQARVAGTAAVVVLHELIAAPARQQQVGVEVIGLEVNGEGLEGLDR